MITFLSPAKQMRPYEAPNLALSRPQFLQEAEELSGLLKALSPWQLESLMKVSPKLGQEVFFMTQAFSAHAPGSPALFSYHGLQYQHIAPAEFTPEDLAFAQDHLAILSGLYGLVRPLDGISPYRLEMGCPLDTGKGDLYHYWGDKLAQALTQTGEVLLNLASKEYSKAVLPHLAGRSRCITCDFLTYKGGKYKTLATWAKMARGEMTRYIMQNRIDDPKTLWDFSWEGFSYAPHRSNEETYVFIQG